MQIDKRNRILKWISISPILIAAVAISVIISCSRGEKTATEEVTEDGFAGSESCRECHEEFYQLWGNSHHGLAMQPVTPEYTESEVPALAEWQPVEGGQFRVEKRDGELIFVEKSPEGERIEHIARQAMGGKNIIYFLTDLEKGRLQTLPLAFDINRDEWYNTQNSAMRHFDSEDEDEALPWKHHLYTFNTTCHDCHVSQLTKNYDVEKDEYFTIWKEPGINCEACHGESVEHIKLAKEAMKSGKPLSKDNMGLIVTTTFTADQHNSSCSTCHAKMGPLTGKFNPGDRFYDHFTLTTFEDPDYYPDGRDLGENYTYTSWSMNPCSAGGGDMHCVTCHTSSGRNRFAGDKANDACVKCHEGKVANVEKHSHHKDAKCVQCHMPKTEFARMRRSDHSMRPPMPAATIKFGSPNSCNICHEDKSPEWADKKIKSWNGDTGYQDFTLEAGQLIVDARKGNWSRIDDMIKFIEEYPKEEIYVNSLIRMLGNTSDSRKWDIIYDSSKNNPSPLVRSSAIAGVALDSDYQKVQKALIEALDDDYRVVRVAASSALAMFSLDNLPEADRAKIGKHLKEYENSLVIRPDDWAAHYNLGNFYSQQNQLDKAIKEYDISINIFDEAVVALVNGGYSYAIAGNSAKADSLLSRALELEPNNEAANLNYALLQGELGDSNKAEKYFRKVLEVNEKSAIASYNLAVMVAQNNLKESVALCKVAADNAPNNPKYRYTYAYYLMESGNSNQSIKELNKIVAETPQYYDAWMLLGNIYEKRSDITGAVKVYNRAVQVPEFQGQAAESLKMRITHLEAMSQKPIMQK